MTCNDTTEYAVIYELEHIVAEMTISSRGKSRRVRNEHIAFDSSRETAPPVRYDNDVRMKKRKIL